MFRWVDSRWTPRAALDLTLTPWEVHQEMYKPWPRGMRPAPGGAAAEGGSAHAVTTDAGGSNAAEEGASVAAAPTVEAEGAAEGSASPRKQTFRGGRASPTESTKPAGTGTGSYADNNRDPACATKLPTGGGGRQAWKACAVPQPSVTPAAVTLPSRAKDMSEAGR